MTLQKKILVIDDEASIRKLITKAFNKTDYEVKTSESAEAALDLIEQESFQIFIIDLMLPQMSGLELCRKIKKLKPTAFTFAMTGYASVFDLVKCREAGFDDYFTKPFDLNTIMSVTDETFKKLERWRNL